MKKLNLIKLPVLAALVAIVSAFSISEPSSKILKNNKEVKLMAYIGGIWVNITGKVQGDDYECAVAPTSCTALFNNGVMVPGTLVEGAFYWIE